MGRKLPQKTERDKVGKDELSLVMREAKPSSLVKSSGILHTNQENNESGEQKFNIIRTICLTI